MTNRREWDTEDAAPEGLEALLASSPVRVRVGYTDDTFEWVEFKNFDPELWWVRHAPDRYGGTHHSPEDLWGVET